MQPSLEGFQRFYNKGPTRAAGSHHGRVSSGAWLRQQPDGTPRSGTRPAVPTPAASQSARRRSSRVVVPKVGTCSARRPQAPGDPQQAVTDFFAEPQPTAQRSCMAVPPGPAARAWYPPGAARADEGDSPRCRPSGLGHSRRAGGTTAPEPRPPWERRGYGQGARPPAFMRCAFMRWRWSWPQGAISGSGGAADGRPGSARRDALPELGARRGGPVLGWATRTLIARLPSTRGSRNRRRCRGASGAGRGTFRRG